MSDAGWLLVGLVLGVVLTVVISEWHLGQQRRTAARRTRHEDTATDRLPLAPRVPT